MSLADRFESAPVHRERASIPKGCEPSVRYESGRASEVTVNVPVIGENEQTWREEIARVTGLSIPGDREVVLVETRYWGNSETPMISARFDIRDRVAKAQAIDIDDLIATAKSASRHIPTHTDENRAIVVGLADFQVGKTGSRGGTQDLIERFYEKLELLEQYAGRAAAGQCYIFDAGDCCESFENVGSQLFTNDLSFPEQLRLSRRLYQEVITRMARIHERVVVVGVPSNHAQWRKGKDLLGRPGDDFGLENLTAIADALAVNPGAYGHVSFVIPDVWEETATVDVCGTIVGLAHGHQVTKPEAIPDWWAKQSHGGQPISDAEILVTGHFHSLRVQSSGRSSHNGRSKWWIQCPTLDAGSDWYRHKAGYDSDPGLLVFGVDSNGWDHMRLL